MIDTPFTTNKRLAEKLGQQLLQSEHDLIEVVPLPTHTDRSARMRALEQALQEFDTEEDSEEFEQYIVQIKPKRRNLSAQFNEEPVAEAPQEQVYLADGSLNVPYLLQNAELLMGYGDYALARNIFLKVAQAGQSATYAGRALFRVGACFEAEQSLDEARNYYEQSLTFQPSLETYQHLATLLIHQKKDRPAAETLERALNLKETSSKTRFELLKAAGNCWTRAGEMASAERAYKKALEVEPTADEIQANLGALYLKAGKFAEARRKFQDTLAANPDNDKALTGLGMCLIQDGDKRAAHDHFARALDIQLNNSQAVYHLVKCAYEIKSFATAARIVENYIQIAPVNINLLYSLAGLQFHLGRMEDANATVNQILNLNPTHTGAKDLLRRIENF
jgi:tetratricopeptide (TPR) repeat protein